MAEIETVSNVCNNYKAFRVLIPSLYYDWYEVIVSRLIKLFYRHSWSECRTHFPLIRAANFALQACAVGVLYKVLSGSPTRSTLAPTTPSWRSCCTISAGRCRLGYRRRRPVLTARRRRGSSAKASSRSSPGIVLSSQLVAILLLETFFVHNQDSITRCINTSPLFFIPFYCF